VIPVKVYRWMMQKIIVIDEKPSIPAKANFFVYFLT